jgi:hypothetical protein
MMNFPRDILFEPEPITNNNFHCLSSRSKKLYLDWLPELQKGKTFFGLHWHWPRDFNLIVPEGFFDTYVFSWHVENWDHTWLKEFCENHKDSKVVIISEFPLVDNYYDIPNLKCLVHHAWGIIINDVLSFDTSKYIPSLKRSKKLSSLVNKPSYFKALITAHILKNHNNSSLVFSWNINQRNEICGSLQLLNESLSPRLELIPLIEYYHSNLKNKKFKLDNDSFDISKITYFSRLNGYFCDNVPFTDCLVNITNETYSQSCVNEINFPGPFITEKTWKPLLGGCALSSQGPCDTYNYLEKFGFIFEYPWNLSYDKIPGDIDRFLTYLEVVDHIFNIDHDELSRDIEHSCHYNYYHIRSTKFQNIIRDLNSQHLSEFLSAYQ